MAILKNTVLVNNGNTGWTTSNVLDATVFQVAVDCDNNKIWYGINNSWMGVSGTTVTAGTGNPATGANGQSIAGDVTDYVFAAQCADQQSSCRLGINFGQDSTFAGYKTAGGNSDANGYGDFQYTPPSGFVALCSQNMPAPAIDPLDDATPEDHFNTVLYTGDGATTHAITGVGFQPDFVWAKVRNQIDNNWLVDGLRGTSNPTGGRYYLVSNSVNAENTASFSTDRIKALGSDGFTVGTTDKMFNGNGDTYVAWCWKGANSSGTSNTDGSITSTVSANPDAGFSIVTYTGIGSNITIGHGLAATPDMIIVKNRTAGYYWQVQHSGLPSIGYNLYLQRNDAQANDNAFISKSSSTFGVNGGESVGYNTHNSVAYCFASKDGFSKFGKYTGNGSTNGTFIYTGFRPAFIIMKRTDTAANWIMVDNKRIGYNVNNYDLSPDQQIAEEDNDRLDIVSNGFKFRSAYGTGNASGGTYIYMAFAEQPFKYANAR